jgi:hypothetical protein
VLVVGHFLTFCWLIAGNLLTHMHPPINPLRFIDDLTDVKPRDWDERPKITDSSAVKPVDWDETQPRKLIDSTAKKPLYWQDNKQTHIADPEALKPKDWDDEQVGGTFSV